jgi:phosphatidylglycerophosphate synthase
MGSIETDNNIARSHLSRKLRDALCKNGWHPNHVTILGMLFTVAMLALHLRGRYAAAAVCVLIRSYTDILDGDMARGCGLTSTLGGALDSMSDTLFWCFIGFMLMRRLTTSVILRVGVPVGILGAMWLYGLFFVSANVFEDHTEVKKRFPFVVSNTLVITQLVYAILIVIT